MELLLEKGNEDLLEAMRVRSCEGRTRVEAKQVDAATTRSVKKKKLRGEKPRIMLRCFCFILKNRAKRTILTGWPSFFF